MVHFMTQQTDEVMYNRFVVFLLSGYLCLLFLRRCQITLQSVFLPSFFGVWVCQKCNILEPSWQEWCHSRESSPVQVSQGVRLHRAVITCGLVVGMIKKYVSTYKMMAPPPFRLELPRHISLKV